MNKTTTQDRKAPTRHLLSALLALMLALAMLPTVTLTQARAATATITESTTWNDGDVVNGSIIIEGGTVDEPLVITVNGTVTLIGGSIYFDKGAHVLIKGGTEDATLIRGSELPPSSYMLSVNNGTNNNHLTLENIVIDGNNISSTTRPIVVPNGCSLTLSKGSVIQNHRNTSTSYIGGGVIQNQGTVVVDGGVIKDNAVGYGGAFYLRADTPFDFRSGSIQNVTNLDGNEKWAINSYVDKAITFSPTGDIEIDGAFHSQNSKSVTASVVPQEGYPIASVTANGTLLESGGDGSYSLPAITSGLSIVLDENSTDPEPETYAITIDEGITNGTIAADVAEAEAGETVTLTVAPAEGYRLVAGSLTVNNGTADVELVATDDANVFSFIMPEAAVTVTAAFEEIVTTPSVGAPGSGDLDGEGTTASDALRVARAVISGTGDLTPAQILAADMDGDNVLTMADVVRILRKAAGLS